MLLCITFADMENMNLGADVKPVNYTINVRGQLLDLSHPLVMGIMNVTPDSFLPAVGYRQRRLFANVHMRLWLKGQRLLTLELALLVPTVTLSVPKRR